MFDWFNTETENKRDDYYKLYENLKEAISEHDQLVSEAHSAYRSYISAVPDLSNRDIPSNDFEHTREKLNAQLNRYFQQDQENRDALIAAKNKAYERYVHYKNLAMKEAEEKRVRREKELQELKEKLEDLF
ncbi:hypothetical protein [Neobacillus vireti]|uniref:hypothetical protein n=1 Tax=Neobacillus vireti TaxID=220686 RepID=UPI0030003854